MGDLIEPRQATISSRAMRKALTRDAIVAAGHGLFAEHGFDAVTISDLAAAAGVSVQTVFNHFASKEEIFFAQRDEWVEGAARAVRDRPADVPPKTALREHLVRSVDAYMRAAAGPAHQRLIAVLAASPALRAYERGLHEESVAKLAAELATAWGCGDDPSGDCSTAAEVTASIWMAAVRSVLVHARSAPPASEGDETCRAAVALISRVLGDLDRGLSISHGGVGGAAFRTA